MCVCFARVVGVGKLWLPVPQVRAPVTCHGAGLGSARGHAMGSGDGGEDITQWGLFKLPL